jgi:hypothetical protein
MLAWTAIALGVWAGLKASPQPAHNITSVVRRVGVLSSQSVKDVAGARLPAHYLQIGKVEIDGSSFAILSEQAGPPPTKDAVSGGGFADVFDQHGLLVKHYTATENTNNSWEVMEFVRLPPENPTANRIRKD